MIYPLYLENIDNAANLMRENQLDFISVIDDNNKLVGMVTKESIIEASDDLNEDFWLD